MILSAAIPTKNRPAELVLAVKSICAQSRQPEELVIVDQSPGRESREGVEAVLAAAGKGIDPVYVHDPAIPGLVAAKQSAVARARGDVVCFLEDDLVLEPGYFAAIEQGFAARPDMLGCCGLVTNLPALPPFYVELFHLFHRGIFRDPRVGVHGHLHGENLPLIPSDWLSGGLSCWRKQVFTRVPFDIANGFFMLEDADFSTRARQAFGPHFYINPNARTEHRMSPVNREMLGTRQKRKLREYVVFYKKRAASAGAGRHLGWLLAGLFLESAAQCLRARSVAPAAGFFSGLADGVRWKLRGEQP